MKLQFSFKNKLVQQITISIVAIVVAVLILVFIKNDITKRSDVVRNFKIELASRNRAVSSFLVLKEGEETAKQYKTILENRLPMREELINFPKEVTNLALRDTVEIGFTFSGSELREDQPDVEYLIFSIKSLGSYEESIDFLKRLEDHRYFISLRSIDFTKSEKGLFQGTLSGTVATRGSANENLQRE